MLALLAKTDYPFLDIMWTMFIFFAWVIWVAFLVFILVDNFKRTDHSGVAKAGWTLLLIFVPLIGALIYMVARDQFSGIEPQFWYFWIGILLVTVVLVLPNGILGGLSKLWARWRGE